MPPAPSSPVAPVSSTAARSSPPTSSSPTARSSPPASPSPRPDPGTLTESPGIVRLTQSAAGGPYTGTFTLTAAGGPVSFGIVGPASESYLSASPASGRLSAGQVQQVTVTLTPNPNGPKPVYDNTLTANPGGITITVEYPPAG